jgi:hypothetical protein
MSFSVVLRCNGNIFKLEGDARKSVTVSCPFIFEIKKKSKKDRKKEYLMKYLEIGA